MRRLRERIDKFVLWMTIITSVLSVLFLVTTYLGWFVPSPSIVMFFGIISLALYVSSILDKNSSRKKEVLLLFVISLYINIFISGTIYRAWTSETIFTKEGITQMSVFLLLVLSIALIVAYIRAKVNYKQVRGNQRHNNMWRISKKEYQKMKESDDIYINLGIYHQPDKD